MTAILGNSAFDHDSAATLLVDDFRLGAIEGKGHDPNPPSHLEARLRKQLRDVKNMLLKPMPPELPAPRRVKSKLLPVVICEE